MNEKTQVTLRTGGWYGDRKLVLNFPEDWELAVFRPLTPPPWSARQIATALEQPVGQQRIRELSRGKKRPLVIVDDLVRPTPASCVMPLLLREFQDAGIHLSDVTVMVGTGTHAGPTLEDVEKKIGSQAAEACRLLVHDHKGDAVNVGRTSFGTPVLVDKAVTRCDFLVGIGGVYPNYSGGFGGGSKLALGVLGTRSIEHLHYKHEHPGWGISGIGTNFRKDLDEIAEAIGLTTMITIHVDANRQPVRVVCGDPRVYYAEAEAISRQYYRSPMPGGADVVIANAYPTDATLQFAHMKGTTPLHRAAPNASRVLLASCRGGVSNHGLFPLLKPPPKYRSQLRRFSTRSFGQNFRFAFRKLQRSVQPRRPDTAVRSHRHPTWLFQTDPESQDLPPVPGLSVSRSWDQILENIVREQGDGRHLKVAVYPCAAMQFLDPTMSCNEVSTSTDILEGIKP
jgi:nickel-dependent lactate racemase